VLNIYYSLIHYPLLFPSDYVTLCTPQLLKDDQLQLYISFQTHRLYGMIIFREPKIATSNKKMKLHVELQMKNEIIQGKVLLNVKM